MKKLLAIILALAMILCLSISVFAEEEETVKKTIIKIEASEGDTTARTYNAYKLLNLKVSHKDEDHGYVCPFVEGDPDKPHVVDCYNYAYTVNPKYRAILQKEVFEHTVSSFWTELNATQPNEADDIEDTYIITYLSKLQGDNGSDYNTLRKTADRIYRAMEGIAADETLTTTVQNEVEQGYWMLVDVTKNGQGNALNGNDAYSVAILTTNAQDVITIRPKTSLPEFEKKVKDTNDSQYADSTQHEWTDTADHDIGDAIPFKLTATLPTNLVSFETYKMEFHDTLSAGLELDATSFKIYLFNNKFTADEDTDLADMTPIYTSAETNANFVLDVNGNSFTVTINDAKAITGADAGKAIVIIYKAKLKDVEDGTVLGAAGNANTAYLKYSNDPYNAASMGQTAADVVKVFTYGLHITKVDNLGHKLKGAGFTLFKYIKNADGVNEYVAIGGELGGKTEDGTALKEPDRVTFDWKGLDNGRYLLRETTVPDGFNKMEDLEFTIASGMINGNDPALDFARSQSLGGDIQADGEFAGMFTMNVVNNTGSVLPSTGAEGTFMLITGGTVLVILAAVFMITRKKMSIYED